MSTSLGFPQPAIGSNNWGVPTNAGWALLNQYLAGIRSLPGNFSVLGNVTIVGSVTAGSFIGLSGVFLTSALFNQPNGIPQLNGAAKIPPSLLASNGVVAVIANATPTFDLSQGSVFEVTLGQNQVPVFANATQGPALIGVRVIQAASGGPYSFTWPANVRGAGTVSPGAGARSMQLLMLAGDGNLDAAAGMVYS